MEIRPDTEWVDSRYAAEIIDVDLTSAAQPGIVIHRKPLTVVVAPAADPAATAPLATVMVDALIANGELTFGPVAEALQAFVVAHQPTGVAALLDVAPDPIVFLFDQAVALEPGATHHGEGRSGWNTVFVSGDMVTLAAGAAHLGKIDTLPGWSRLFAGTAPGAGARTALTLIDASQPADPPPAQANTLAAERLQADHQAADTGDASASEINVDASDVGEPADLASTAAANGQAVNGAATWHTTDQLADVEQPGDLAEAATETRAMNLPELGVPASEANLDLTDGVDLDLTETNAEELTEAGLPDIAAEANDSELGSTEVNLAETAPEEERVDWFNNPVGESEMPPVPVGAPVPQTAENGIAPSGLAPPPPGPSPDTNQPPASQPLAEQSPPPPPPSFAVAQQAQPGPPPPPADLEPEPWSQPGQPPLPDVELNPVEAADTSPPLPDQISLTDMPPPPAANEPVDQLPPPPPGFEPAQSGPPPMPTGVATVDPEPISAPPPWPDVAPLPAGPEPLNAEELSKLPPPPDDAEPSR